MTKGGTVRPPCFAERRPLPRSALAHAPRLRRWLAFFCKACAYRIESTSAQGASVAQPGDEEEPAASFRPDFELGTPKQNATANADPGDGHAAFHPGKLIRMRGRSLSPPLSPPPPSTCSNCVATPRAPSRTLTGRAAGAAGVSPACAPRFLVRRVPRSATRRAACGIGSRGTLTSSIRVASTRRAARGARRLARKRTRARASAPRTARRITWTRCTRAASPPRVGAPPRSGTPKIHGALRCTAMPTARAVRPPAPAPPRAQPRGGSRGALFCDACQHFVRRLSTNMHFLSCRVRQRWHLSVHCRQLLQTRVVPRAAARRRRRGRPCGGRGRRGAALLPGAPPRGVRERGRDALRRGGLLGAGILRVGGQAPRALRRAPRAGDG